MGDWWGSRKAHTPQGCRYPYYVFETRDDSNLDDLEMAAWRAVVIGAGRLVNRLDEELTSETGLTMAEYEVLSCLSEAPGGRMRMAELAGAVVVSRSGLTRRVDSLVSAGYVRRSACSSDRRGTYAELTKAGVLRLENTAGVHRAGVREHFIQALSRSELAAVAQALGRVAESLAKPPPPRSAEAQAG